MPLPSTVSYFSKSRLVLPFWYWLTWIFPDKRVVVVFCNRNWPLFMFVEVLRWLGIVERRPSSAGNGAEFIGVRAPAGGVGVPAACGGVERGAADVAGRRGRTERLQWRRGAAHTGAGERERTIGRCGAKTVMCSVLAASPALLLDVGYCYRGWHAVICLCPCDCPGVGHIPSPAKWLNWSWTTLGCVLLWV